MGIVDINCDLGEGVAIEAALLPFISSCNIACGGHAGNLHSMKETVLGAKANNIAIGAHPSYPDREGFGRRDILISAEALRASIEEQLGTFDSVLKGTESVLHHIKAHGALYNAIAKDMDLAHVFLDAVEAYKSVPIFVPYGSTIAMAAKARGFRYWFEAFADRRYHANLNLVSRKVPGAVINRPSLVLEQIVSMIQWKRVKSIEGSWATIHAQTYCVHGDTPAALKILQYLHDQLPKYNIQIKK